MANLNSGNNSRQFLSEEGFTHTQNGLSTALFFLRNSKGATAAITNYGGRLVGLWVPDKNGNLRDVVIGFDNVQDYASGEDTYFGALVGRYANRIAKGRFWLEGQEYRLATNNGPNHLHGGAVGFARVVWSAEQLDGQTLQLTYLSQDGEEGYPGKVEVKATYFLSENNELKVSYAGTTDKTTILNVTNHAYFNLNGENGGSILKHTLQINAAKYTPVDSSLIPTGEVAPVANTPFDFTQPTAIGERIDQAHQQLQFGQGYDHNFVLATERRKEPAFAASVLGDESGIFMEVFTQEPGIQLYTGNFLEGAHTLKSGIKDEHRTSFCLETQLFPDSPNQPGFPSAVLNPNDKYQTTTVYKFTTK